MSSTSRLVPGDVLLLDQATLKLPVDNLRKVQKVTQKTYEYNLGPTSAFQKDLDELLRKSAASSTVAPEQQAEMLKTIDGMLSKMRGLKRKMTDLSNQSHTANRVATTRLNHLTSLPDTVDAPTYPSWARRRLSHQLTDYFLRASPPLKQSALVLAKEEGIEELMDLELWEELSKAEDGLRAGRLDEVLSWVGENRTALRKMKVR